MMTLPPIVPAFIPQSAAEVGAVTTALAMVPELHLDVVDGQFVVPVSWPYTPPGDPKEVKHLLDPFTLEVDLMVKDPLPAARAWLAAGADMLVFHVETLSLAAFTEFGDTTGATVGVSANNDTPDDVLFAYAAVADYVQVMGIATIGAQGQPFDERALVRVLRLRERFPQLLIAIDGSVNATTLGALASLPIGRFIIGSAIVKAPVPAAAYASYVSLLQSSTAAS